MATAAVEVVGLVAAVAMAGAAATAVVFALLGGSCYTGLLSTDRSHQPAAAPTWQHFKAFAVPQLVLLVLLQLNIPGALVICERAACH